ncbi:MAG: nuclear transport factor 2 family protein [Sphingomonas sp.]
MTDETLRALADRQAITDLIHRYCRAVDRLDVPLGHSIWHEGGHADYGAGAYVGEGKGAIDHICAQHRQTLAHSHQVTNVVIDLDGDAAGSEAYHFATLRVGRPGATKQISVWGRYVDRWARRDGRWGLVERVAVRDFDEMRDVTPLYDHDVGRRDATDPSYRVLRGGAA